MATLSSQARYEAKSSEITDPKLQRQLCNAKGVIYYNTASPNQLVEDTCVSKTEFRLLGKTYNKEGKLTIVHYELEQDVWGKCKVQSVLVPKRQYVVTKANGSKAIGEIAEEKEHWEMSAVLQGNRGSCFQ